MLPHALKALLDALANCHRRHHDDELGEAIATVELVDGADVDIGLASARLHLYGEVAQAPLCGNAGRREVLTLLDGMEVVFQLGDGEAQAVGVAHLEALPLKEGAPFARRRREAGFHELLTPEEVADALHGLDLVLLIG